MVQISLIGFLWIHSAPTLSKLLLSFPSGGCKSFTSFLNLESIDSCIEYREYSNTFGVRTRHLTSVKLRLSIIIWNLKQNNLKPQGMVGRNSTRVRISLLLTLIPIALRALTRRRTNNNT